MKLYAKHTAEGDSHVMKWAAAFLRACSTG